MHTPDLIRDIEERLVYLCGLVAVDGASNRLNTHLDLEDFFVQVLNALLGTNLRNANYDSFNNAGYDLVDDGSGLVVQVTADCLLRACPMMIPRVADTHSTRCR